MSLGVINIGINPIAIPLGPGGGIHWYGIFYAVAFLTAYRFGVLPHVLPRGVTRELAERMVVTIIVTGLIGARLYFVIQQPNLVRDYVEHPLRIVAVWEGGMAFFGAIIASALTLLYFAWRLRMPFWMMFDAGAFFAVVGQPIGRIGNVINGDILGAPSNAWFATAYTFRDANGGCAVLQAGFHCGVGYQPAAVYEALGTIAIGIVLFLLRRRGVRPGTVAITYVALYAVSQILIFFLRNSEPVIGLGLKQAQWTGLVILVVVVPGMIYLRRRWPSADRVDGPATVTSPAATA